MLQGVPQCCCLFGFVNFSAYKVATVNIYMFFSSPGHADCQNGLFLWGMYILGKNMITLECLLLPTKKTMLTPMKSL